VSHPTIKDEIFLPAKAVATNIKVFIFEIGFSYVQSVLLFS